MAIEAPLSKYKRNSFLIGIGACVVLSVWCAYDGYLNKSFKEAHPEWWVTNRVGPFILLPAAAILGVWWCAIRGRKIVANDSELIIPNRPKISYEAIESIDKTHFESKGFFTIIYRHPGGSEAKRRLYDRDYDNLPAILDHLVAKIT